MSSPTYSPSEEPLNVPPMNNAVREQLTALVEARYGEISVRVLGHVSRNAGVQPSTLRRYFDLYPGKQRTERLQEGTLRAVLLALGADPFEFLRATGSVQIEIWPAAVVQEITPVREGRSDLEVLAEIVGRMPLPVRVRAARAAVAAALGSIAETGETVPEEGYELLRHLDGLNREVRHLKLMGG